MKETNKDYPLPVSMERFKDLCEAYLVFSENTGVKVTITIEPLQVKKNRGKRKMKEGK